jgi:phosphoribosylamine--glycine ligase/phosphoribosylformylglycinamidine cyclo-ligase
MILPRTNIFVGDVLLGVASSGVHSNGFSLIRKIVTVSQLSYSSPCPWDSTTTLGRALLEPTRIYIKQVLPAAQDGWIKSMAHITGGGFIDNLPRALPRHLGCDVDVSTWTLPPVFRWIKERGGVAPEEMARTFNNGIGLVVVVAVEHVPLAMQALRQAGDAQVYEIGKVTERRGVEMRNLEQWN